MDSQTSILLLAGILFLVVGADLVVRAASRLAVRAGISPLVVGLTVVAFGTSAPELAVTVHSCVRGETSLAMGNIIGSNISNVLLILGLAATIRALSVSQKVVRLEVPLLLLLSGAVYGLGRDGGISRVEGVGLFLVSVVYTGLVIRQSRGESRRVRIEYDREFPRPEPDAQERAQRGVGMDVLKMVGGLALLVLGAQFLVAGALEVVAAYGLSEVVTGLTVVAIGTSLPEIATVVIASIKGERDIAVGNVLGSNLYNLLVVLGIGAAATPDGIEVPKSTLYFDLPVMIAVSAACLPVFFTGHRIARWEGLLFLGYYGAYITYLMMFSQDHQYLNEFSLTMVLFVIPFTVITLGVTVLYALRRRTPPDGP